MKITECRVNRLENPLGFLLGEPSLSWKVTESQGKRAVQNRIVVSKNEAMTDICYDSGVQAPFNAVDFPLRIPLQPRTRYWWQVWVR